MDELNEIVGINARMLRMCAWGKHSIPREQEGFMNPEHP
jgi:hypothetical protein